VLLVVNDKPRWLASPHKGTIVAALTYIVLRLCISMGYLPPSLAIVNVFGELPGHAASHPFISKTKMKT